MKSLFQKFLFRGFIAHSKPVQSFFLKYNPNRFYSYRYQADDFSKCFGCGAVIQTKNENQVGFISENIVQRYLKRIRKKASQKLKQKEKEKEKEKENQNQNQFQGQNPPHPNEINENMQLICKRCFSLRHYNRLEKITQDSIISQPQPLNSDSTLTQNQNQNQNQGSLPINPLSIQPNLYNSPDIQTVLSQLKHIRFENGIILVVIDIFDFPGSISPLLQKIIHDQQIIIVGNKYDLLPLGTDHQKVRSWLAFQSRSLLTGCKIKDSDGVLSLLQPSSKHSNSHIPVYLVSAKTGEGLNELAEGIFHHSRNKSIYLLGSANVGKSNLLNQLYQHFDGAPLRKATTSPIPGTTLREIRFPTKGGYNFFDTPGIPNSNQLIQVLTFKELEYVVPKKPVRPVTYILQVGRGLCFGGLATIEHLKGPGPIYLTVYVSHLLPIHVSSIEKIPQLQKDLRNGESKFLFPPMGDKQRLSLFPQMKEHHFTLEAFDQNQSLIDIVISGLGWASVTCYSGSSDLKVCVPQGIQITTREPLFPHDIRKRKNRQKGGLKSRFTSY